jgi:hypothetical protein
VLGRAYREWSNPNTFTVLSRLKTAYRRFLHLASELLYAFVMKRLLSILLVPVLVCALTGKGQAQASESGKQSKWYGWQVLVADGVSDITLITGLARDSGPTFYVGAASYVITPAVIHVLHGNYGRAALGTLMRIVLPVGGALLTYELLKSQSDSPDSEYNRMGWGLMSLLVGALGMGAATTLDMAFASESPVHPAGLSPLTSSKSYKMINFTTAGIVPAPSGA